MLRLTRFVLLQTGSTDLVLLAVSILLAPNAQLHTNMAMTAAATRRGM